MKKTLSLSISILTLLFFLSGCVSSGSENSKISGAENKNKKRKRYKTCENCVPGDTPLITAIRRNDTLEALKLIQADKEVETENELGLSPYFYANVLGNSEVSNLLASKNVNQVIKPYRLTEIDIGPFLANRVFHCYKKKISRKKWEAIKTLTGKVSQMVDVAQARVGTFFFEGEDGALNKICVDYLQMLKNVSYYMNIRYDSMLGLSQDNPEFDKLLKNAELQLNRLPYHGCYDNSDPFKLTVRLDGLKTLQKYNRLHTEGKKKLSVALKMTEQQIRDALKTVDKLDPVQINGGLYWAENEVMLSYTPEFNSPAEKKAYERMRKINRNSEYLIKIHLRGIEVFERAFNPALQFYWNQYGQYSRKMIDEAVKLSPEDSSELDALRKNNLDNIDKIKSSALSFYIKSDYKDPSNQSKFLEYAEAMKIGFYLAVDDCLLQQVKSDINKMYEADDINFNIIDFKDKIDASISLSDSMLGKIYEMIQQVDGNESLYNHYLNYYITVCHFTEQLKTIQFVADSLYKNPGMTSDAREIVQKIFQEILASGSFRIGGKYSSIKGVGFILQDYKTELKKYIR